MAKQRRKFPDGTLVECRTTHWGVPVGSTGIVLDCDYQYQVEWDHKGPTGGRIRSWVSSQCLKEYEVFIEGDDDDDCI